MRQLAAERVGAWSLGPRPGSKTYDSSMFSRGTFDELVARCPGDQGDFYDRGATRLAGKYEWYCASRAKYLQWPPRQTELTLMGFYSSSSPLDSVSQKHWNQQAFVQSVSFNDNFYPLANGQCYVDFADPKVGGGVFRSGLAQEEKLFLQLPELLAVVRERAGASRPLYLSTGNDGRHRRQ